MSCGRVQGYPSNYSSCCSTFTCLPQGARWNILEASVIPWKEIKGKQAICNAWISGACITVSLASSRPGWCQLDLKWSRSEATARSCGFPLTLMPGVMPWGPCIIICFPFHLIVLATGFYVSVLSFFYIVVSAGSFVNTITQNKYVKAFKNLIVIYSDNVVLTLAANTV